MKFSLLRLACLGAFLLGPVVAQTNDPYAWLEDVIGEKPLAWARQQNEIAQRELEADVSFPPLTGRLLSILESDDRIPAVAKRGEYYYNFWRDKSHVRGLWRRTTLDEYRKPKPAWETVLDLDALAIKESENWVWKGADFLRPDHDRCMISLSRGGADAAVQREFDVVKKEFVPDGFRLAEAKSDLSWKDRDTLLVGTDFGADSLTTSGYPRVTKEWRRGTPLSAARTVFEGEKSDVSISAAVSIEPGFRREIVSRALTFFTAERSIRQDGRLTRIDIPADAGLGTWREYILVTLRSDWTVGGRTHPSGALLAMTWDRFLAGERAFETLFTPGPRKSLAGTSALRHHVIVNELENVRNKLYVLTPRSDGKWARAPLDAPEFGALSVSAVDDDSDSYWLTVTDFLTPPTLHLGTIGKPDRESLKSAPAFFNTDGFEISQYEATSRDGTRVPYFLVSRKGLKLDGSNPTLLTGYGGFRVSRTPGYSGGLGAAWLEKGGVYILANIRGGGEFGPSWHQAALKEKRQTAYDDFIAIAEDLVARKITSPRHLGIQGGSNGGLLMGVMLTQRPDLFGAIVCQVPLLDMQRYNHLLAGASWMGEYGDPDKPEEWAFIRKYSPYHNVSPDRKYPRVLFTTSTRDDRVHPGHARKMVAKMKDQGHDVLYYENIEGGHGGAANSKQSAYMSALAYTFLWRELSGVRPVSAAPTAPGFLTTPTGLQYAITTHGTGPRPQKGQVVIAHYKGTLADGTVFDDSNGRPAPFAFTLGQGHVIKGWNEGFALLRVGDKATFIIPPELAYGDRPRTKIPPNSTLRFDVEFLGLKDRALSDVLRDTIEDEGITAARLHFDQLRKDGLENHHVSESQLNAQGYRYLRANRNAEALAFFQINVLLFPDSPNVYDSLGEGFLKSGQRDAALLYYKRALALDPANTNARKFISELAAPSAADSSLR